MTYDPQAHGARCDVCPLASRRPVPPEGIVGDEEFSDEKPSAAIVVVGDAPRGEEEKFGRSFVGSLGQELVSALRGAGIDRRHVHVTNTVLCRPPNDRLSDLLKRIARHNRQEERAAKKEGREPSLIASPLDCCAPRLQREIAPFSKAITLGKTATQAVSGVSASIQAVRGGLLEVPAGEGVVKSVMPTLHPHFVGRMPKWRHVFKNDFAKAGRWFRGEGGWNPPVIRYHPSADELREFLFQDRLLVFDLETDDIESLTTQIRCVGIGTADEVMLVGLLGIDGHTKFYPPEEEARVLDVLKEYFSDERYTKAGHNAGYFDRIVIRERWGVDPKPIVDSMLLHRSVESELPHSLAYVGSMYTDAPAWKTDRSGRKLSHEAETDEQLHEYCAFDVGVNARVLPPLVDQVRLRHQVGVWQVDQKMQAICADMHTAGMYVDQRVRHEEEIRLLARRHELLEEIRDRVERPAFNPASVQQMADLLFSTWALSPQVEERYLTTDTGAPSTNDYILRALLSDKLVPKAQREVIKLIRYYRKVQKVLGTYVVKLRPSDVEVEEDLGWDEDEAWMSDDTLGRYGLVRKGIVDPATGRMHPGYNAHVAVTGRLSSSKPINAQNFPKEMRRMVVAAPGNVLVGADKDQLELRIAASRWQVQLYLRAFAEGKDPHSMTAFAVFGRAFLEHIGMTEAEFLRPGPFVGPCYHNGKFVGSGEALTMRNLSKAVQYASQYMASVETVHMLIQKTEVPARGPDGRIRGDGTTDLPFALLPLRRVREMRDNWLRGAPEFERGWHKEISDFRRQGYLYEEVTGRRRDFLDGESQNELVNFPIQASAAGLMNKALISLHEEIPLHAWGPGTGIINQCHDSIVVECPADGVVFDEKGRAQGPPDAIPFKVARLLEEKMNQTHPALPGVKFTAAAAVGRSWAEVG